MTRRDRLGAGPIAGGMGTTYLSAAAQERLYRQQRQADALRYLQRRGLDDVAEILGLIQSRSRSTRAEVAS